MKRSEFSPAQSASWGPPESVPSLDLVLLFLDQSGRGTWMSRSGHAWQSIEWEYRQDYLMPWNNKCAINNERSVTIPWICDHIWPPHLQIQSFPCDPQTDGSQGGCLCQCSHPQSYDWDCSSAALFYLTGCQMLKIQESNFRTCLLGYK